MAKKVDGQKVGGRSGVYYKSKMSTDLILMSALKIMFSLEEGTTAAHLQAILI